jgi:hypothetical protein
MCPLLDRVSTPQGDIIILTKTRFYFFFSRPRTSVMPYRVSEFCGNPGFQAVYRTSDPDILAEFHTFFVRCVAAGGFERLMLGAKMGFVDFPPGHEHLRDYIVGFHAPEAAKNIAFENYTNEELAKFAHIRALEWFAWPIFLSYSIAPILLAATQSWVVLAAVLIINFFWHFICHRFVHVGLAMTGVFIFRLRWPAAAASAIYLFLQQHYGLAVVALLWPLLATGLSVFSIRLAYACGTKADLSELESRFFERIVAGNSANNSKSVRAAVVVGLVMVSTIVVFAFGLFADWKRRTSAQVQTESEVAHAAAVTKSQTPKTPPPPATSEETPSPLSSPAKPNPTPLAPAPVVIGEPKSASLKPDSQNLRPDASLQRANTTYRVSGVMEKDFLNMRQGPGSSYPVIQRLQNGVDGVTLIGDPIRSGKTKWQKINSRGVVGWVNADYLTPSMTDRTPEAPAR